MHTTIRRAKGIYTRDELRSYRLVHLAQTCSLSYQTIVLLDGKPKRMISGHEMGTQWLMAPKVDAQLEGT